MSDPLESKVLYYARELVRTKSLSGEEGDVARLIKEFLGGEGVDKVFIDEYGNVVSIIEGGIGEIIVFEGHMDHVPEGDLGNWIVDPYEAKVIDGKLYGRGAVDMKGAIAAMIAMIGLLGETKNLPTIVYVFVPHEEIVEGAAFKYAIEDTLKIKPSLVVLGEATNLNIHVGQRGRTVIHVDLYGETAHASMPDKGVNPIVFAAYLLKEINELNEQLPVHDTLGKSTIVPTIIECSPRSPPMIPDYCRITLDRRFIVGETEEKILGEVIAALDRAQKHANIKNVKARIPVEEIKLWTGRTIKVKHFFPAWLIENNKTVYHLLQIMRKQVNPQARISVWRFSTDGVYSAGTAGFTTIGIGPGDESLAHKPNEYVEIKQLVMASKIYSLVAKSCSYGYS
ncbi:YgeY family selenium metabolism-linked hydrolase [Desulfurococcaceae archaeon MEX13E-LK6-19]|nr:YgeY family selenium metabolism-linked hydrolase [Desulfurococcaceae archaeon MEX13E-LK6-19]